MLTHTLKVTGKKVVGMHDLLNSWVLSCTEPSASFCLKELNWVLFYEVQLDEESVILFHTGVSISTVCASGRTINFKLRMEGMKTKKPEGKKNLYSVARQVFDHIHDNETKPTFEKYSLFIL